MKVLVSRNIFALTLALFAWSEQANSAARQAGRMDEDLYEMDLPEAPPAANSPSSAKNFDIKLCGRIREEFFLWDKQLLFGADKDDVSRYLRNKVDLGVAIKQGAAAGSGPVAEGMVKFSAYNYWLVNHAYDRQTPETITLGGLGAGTSSARPIVTGDAHFHTGLVPQVALEEAWYQLNFGSFVNALKSHPISLKAGYFAYAVGRGLTLGTMSDMGNMYAGWSAQGGFTRFPFTPPGILLQGKLSDSLSWDLYYSKGRSNDGEFGRIFSPGYANRLNGAAPYDPPYLGKGKDRDIYAARLDLAAPMQGGGKVNFQPYFVYTDAQVLPVEFDADSKGHLGTFGIMTELDRNGFNVNVEVAGQFGTQEMFAIDRNTVVLARNTVNGNVQEQYSHLRLVNRGAVPAVTPANGPKAPVIADVTGTANLDRNRSFDRNGQPLLTAAGVPVMAPNAAGANMAVHNSNLWGNSRIRPAYKLNYGGLMGLADVAYDFASKPIKVAAAVGYIGGDKYPYNEEQNKTYKSFMTQRSLYAGRQVKSVMIFEQQTMLRPTNIVNRLLAAENNQRDYANLQFIGTSATWYPLKNKEKFSIQPNVIGLWEVSQLKKWDKNARFNLPGDPDNTAAIQALLNSNGVTGWQSEQDASKCLGVELNTYVNYQIFDNCNWFLVGWVFKPGQLFKDLEGQPLNAFGKRTTPTGGTKMLSQGSETSFGFYTGIDYKF